ncbi:hypothetical protein EMILIAHAH_222 [Bacillus phage vB_BanH_Emiliahah]|nr:hypothetical protein EMILIAHAH_222 [Bacillus phage vB_BanH_Emiliahah]
MKKLISLGLLAIMAMVGLTGCSSEADVVSDNLAKSADSFEVQRRIVFVNGITDKYFLSIEGLCAFDATDKKVSVTCKVGEGKYKKHSLWLSDNTTFFSEQTDAKYEDAYHYKVLFRPEEIIPDIELQTSGKK